jgi:hypothetical protein
MVQRIVIFWMILFATAALADVCTLTTKDQAELGAKLLQINPNFVKYCATCPDKSKTKVHAENINVRTVGYDDPRWIVFVNEENIDLAYTYLDIGESIGINLAKLSGCKTPADIPPQIDLGEALAESKPSNVAAPKESSSIPDENPLRDADHYFQKKDYKTAVRLYEEYVEKNPSKLHALNPKISTCYYNLGVQTIQKASTKKDCGTAADYFSHCLYLDRNDSLANEALRIAAFCKEMGPTLPKLQSEIENLKFRD